MSGNNYTALVAEAARLKTEISVLDYFFQLESTGAIRYDGKKGKEHFFGFDHQKTGSISIKESDNVWYDHAKGEGGDLIRAVQLFENKTFVEALQRLSDKSDIIANGYDAFYKKNGDTEYNIEITKVLDGIKHPALISYMNSRGLDVLDVADVAKEVHWKNGDDHFFAIGFPNANNGFAVRSKVFKGNLNGGGISTFTIGKQPQSIKIFEGSMDFASYRHLNRNDNFFAIILNGTGNLSISLCEKIALKAQEKAIPVHLYFDNGIGGKKATEKAINLVPGSEDKSAFYVNFGLNDINDYLVNNQRCTYQIKR